jgi:hypothetical protein
LASSELKAEESLGEHGEDDEPAGQDGCTIDSAASDSAPTCRTHATIATIHPTANHRERNRPRRYAADGGPRSAERAPRRGVSTKGEVGRHRRSEREDHEKRLPD